MSVINTMLKDLELRGSSEMESDAVLRGLSSNTHGHDRSGKESNYHLVGVLGVLVVVLVMVIIYLVSPLHLLVAEKDKQLVVEKKFESNIDVKPDYNSMVNAEALTPVASAPVAVLNSQVNKSSEEPVRQAAASVVAEVERKPVSEPVRKQAAAVENESVAAADEDPGLEQEISKTHREPTSEEKSQDAYLKALSMYNRGRIQESRVLLKDALKYDAYNLDANKLLASLYLREGKADVAIALIKKGLANYSGNQELLRLYLQAQVQREDYAGAIALMEQHLRLNTPEDIAYLAGLYQKNDGHLSAVKLYSQALQLKPARSVWWMGQGISFEALSKQDEALKSYQQSIVSGQLSTQLAGYVKTRINAIEKSQQKTTS